MKKDKTYRDIVAQVLDYGSWVRGLHDEDIARLYHEHFVRWHPGKPAASLDEAFCAHFGVKSMPEELNGDHELIIVAGSLDPSTERIVTYLAEHHDVNINAVFFRFFRDGDRDYLSRIWLREPTAVAIEPGDSVAGGEWNGEYYVSFGLNQYRDWTEAVNYGFISGGGGPWYSSTLSMLEPGTRVWVNIPGTGCVGVGKVEATRVPVEDFMAGAHAFAAGQNWRDTPAVERHLKSLVSATGTTEAAGLVDAVTSDFAEALRAATIIGRLQGLRRVPFQTRVITQTGAAVGHWVGQGRPAPFSDAAFAEPTVLGPAKVQSNLIATKELLRSSSPAAEAVLLRDLVAACAQAIDQRFIDPAAVAVLDAAPASITNGVAAIPSTGNSLAQVDTDLGAAVDALVAAGSDLAAAQWVLHLRTAARLARMRGTGGGFAYPGLTAAGGTLHGLPAVTSGNVPVAATTGAPTLIALLDASEVLLADDRAAALAVAEQASVEADTAPTAGHRELVSL